MLPRHRINPAYLRLKCVDPAGILLLPRFLVQPGAAVDIISGFRVHPDIVDTRRDLNDPLKQVVPPVLFP
jgi:hypothetical protein